jgi:hypothetical protein
MPGNKLPGTGITRFSVMSDLANDRGAISLPHGRAGNT